jgi:FlaA1/EpsC-like NDP-sugar epimerase
MGEPVKVVDLIREICLLNGKQLGKDLPLEIVGIRPGEKLHEELVYPEENTHEVADGIFMASSDPMNFDEVELAVGRILNFATSNDLKRTTQEISALVTPGPKKDAVHGA